MSDATDRRTDLERGILAKCKLIAAFNPSLVAAMLDVIDAAEAHGHAKEYWERDEGLDGAARLMEADAELRNSVARFREVASGKWL